MKIGRIDANTSFRQIMAVLTLFVVYIVFSEVALNLFDTRNVMNDFEYYASKTFTKEQWADAEKFRHDIISIGQRGVLIKDSIVYRYKPAVSETVNFNSLGFRGKEVEPRKEGEIRIAFFGASRIWGNYLPDDKTIPFLVEKMLQEKLPDRPITVFNIGIEGTDLQRGIATAKMFHGLIGFDIAVFYFGFTDMNYAYLHGEIEWEPFQTDSPMDDETFDLIVRQMFPQGWFKKRKLFNLIFHSVKGELYGAAPVCADSGSDGYGEVPEFPKKAAENFPNVFFNRIQGASEYFKEKEVATMLILPPVPQTKEPLSELEKSVTLHYELIAPGYNRYIKMCAKNLIVKMKEKKNEPKFVFIDHSDIFDHDPSTVFFDGMHMTPDGSKKSAREISAFLAEFLLEKSTHNQKKSNK